MAAWTTGITAWTTGITAAWTRGITAWTVVQAVVKANSQSKRKQQISTPPRGSKTL